MTIDDTTIDQIATAVAQKLAPMMREPRDDDLLTAIDSNWRKAVKAAQVVDLHFHDSRHLAITRLSKVLGLLELARMVGHRDLRMLQFYYNESAAETAAKL